MKPRLLVLSQYFPPEMGAPQARLSELGEALVDAGWSVEVLTALPNYPTGRVFDGYRRGRPAVEEVGRLRTVRVPLVPSRSGFAGRMACYLSFAASAALHGPRLCQPPDLLYVESPPLFIGLGARYLARRWSCPYVLNVSDLWPESAIHMGMLRPGVAASAAERLELSLYRHAAAVTGQTDEIVESIRRRSPDTRAMVLTNAVDARRFGRDQADREARQLVGGEPGPVFVYAGLLGLAQGLDQLLDLARALPADAPGRIVIVGDGPVRPHLERRIRDERLDRVRLLPAQPRHRIPALLACADVALISLGLELPGAVPSKIYEAMAAGLPILLVAGGEARRRVEQAGAGLAVPPGEAGALRQAFERLAIDETLRRRLGDAGRRAAETTYDRRRVAARLDELLRETLQRRAAA